MASLTSIPADSSTGTTSRATKARVRKGGKPSNKSHSDDFYQSGKGGALKHPRSSDTDGEQVNSVTVLHTWLHTEMRLLETKSGTARSERTGTSPERPGLDENQ